MKAPEKIYVDSKAIGDGISTTVHTKRQDYPTCTKYTRTDAFLTKAKKWFEEHFESRLKWETTTYDFEDIQSMVEDFRKVMEG